jgi:hypothetical protein
MLELIQYDRELLIIVLMAFNKRLEVRRFGVRKAFDRRGGRGGWYSRPRLRRARRHHYAVRHAFGDEPELPDGERRFGGTRIFSTRSRRPSLSRSSAR